MTPGRRGEFSRLFIALGCVGFFTVPVFRSGGRTDLTGFQWLINHTIFGPPVEYVPEEDYTRELQGVRITTTVQAIRR